MYNGRHLCICAGTLFLNFAVEAARVGEPRGEPIFSISRVLMLSYFLVTVHSTVEGGMRRLVGRFRRGPLAMTNRWTCPEEKREDNASFTLDSFLVGLEVDWELN